jgi:hypothetical protein
MSTEIFSEFLAEGWPIYVYARKGRGLIALSERIGVDGAFARQLQVQRKFVESARRP